MAKAPAIISLEDFTESINMCIYGDSGVGKTVLGGTCPNALFLSFETGTVSAKRQGSTAKLWKMTTWADVQEAYDWLHDNPDEYKWVVIDSATSMQKLCMRGVIEDENSVGDDPDVLNFKDYPKYYNRFDRFVAMFKDLTQNVLFIATTLRGENEDGDDIILPDIQGRGYHNAQTFCAQMDAVLYYKETIDKAEEDNTRSLLFRNNPPYFAKHRYGEFPRWVMITKGDQFVTTMAAIERKMLAPVKPKVRKPMLNKHRTTQKAAAK